MGKTLLAVVWLVWLGLAFTHSPWWGLEIAALCLGGLSQWLRRFDNLPAKPVHGLDDRRWLPAHAAIFFLAFAYLEWRQPFYFAQDDNFAQFMPIMIASSRSFFSGVFPRWEPHIFFGAPIADSGLYALTYPLTYVSYALSQMFQGEPYALLEYYALLHLGLGGAVTYWHLRRYWQLERLPACQAALSYVLCGYALQAGRSWYYMLPVFLWFPLTIHLLGSWLRQPTVVNGLAMFGALGLFLHSGNAQMWLYTVVLVAMVMMLQLASGQMTKPHLKSGLLGTGFAVLIVGFLLARQILFTRDIARGPWGQGIVSGVKALFLVYPLNQDVHPHHWGNAFLEDSNELYYTHGLFALCAVWAVVALIGRKEECPHCRSDMHSCKNCQYYSPGAHNQCTETISEYVPDKERANFCGMYRAQQGEREAPVDLDAARAKLEALFRK